MIMKDYKHVGHKRWEMGFQLPVILTAINAMLSCVAVGLIVFLKIFPGVLI